MNTNKVLIKCVACVSLLLATSHMASAATRTWTNSVGDQLLGTASNWSPNGTPASGDTIQWDGTAPGSLTLTNAAGLADANPGLNVNVFSGQTSPLTIVEAIGNSGRIRLNTSFVVDSGAGAVTFGSIDTPTLPLALGATGNGSVHGWTNNSANPITINTNCYFLMGGGGSHTLNLAGSGSFVLNNTIQAQNGANLNLTVNGSGAVALVGTPTPGVTYSGTYSETRLNGGTLRLGGDNALGVSTVFITGGNLDSSVADLVNAGNNVQNWNGHFTFVGSQSLDIGSGAVTMNASRVVTVNANTFTVSGPIAGSGFSLTKAGAGTMVLNGANTYTGGTVVSNGVLRLGNAAAIPSGSAAAAAVTVYGTLDVNGNSATVSSLSGTGTVDTTLASGAPILTVGANDASGTFSGIIQNSSGALSLTKSGLGTVTLAGANSYSGGTTVEAGTLLAANAAGSATGPGAVTVNSGATLGGSGIIGGSVTLQPGALAAFTQGSPLALNGNLTLNGNSATVNVPGGVPLGEGNYTLMTYSEAGSSGSFASGAPTFTGAGVASGTVSTITNGNGRVALVVTSTATGVFVWTKDGSGDWTTGANWSSNPNFPQAAGDAATLGVGSAFTTVTLDANETVGGLVFTNANSFAIASTGNTLTMDNATHGAAINVVAGSSNAIATTVSLNDTLSVSVFAGATLGVSGNISGTSPSHTLAISGAGTMTLTGNNTYGPTAGSLGTTLSGPGTLELGSSSALGAGNVDILFSRTVRALAPLSVANNVLVTNGVTATVDNNGHDITLSGVLSGAGGLTKNSAGMLTLSGANSYAGDTTVNGGTLKLGAANAVPTVNVAVNTGSTLDLNGFSLTLNGLNGAGVVDSLTGGAVTLTVGQNGAFALFNGPIQDSSGSLALVKAGAGNQTLAGTNTYTGGTTISAGLLRIGNGGTSGSVGTGPVVDNGILEFNLTGTNSFTNPISGTGALTLANNSLMLVLDTANTFTGNVNVNGGSLWLKNGSALGNPPTGGDKFVWANNRDARLYLDGSAANVTIQTNVNFYLSNDAGNLFNVAGSNTIQGNIYLPFGGGPAMVRVNGGFLTLAGDVTSDGVAGGRTLQLGGAGNGLFSGVANDNGLSGTGPALGSLQKIDAGTWTISGANTTVATATVAGGTLNLIGTWAGPVVVNSGATLAGTGTIGGNATWQAGALALFTLTNDNGNNTTPMTAYGSLTANNNSVTVFVAGSTPLPPGAYTLMTYNGTSSGAFATGTPTFTGAGVAAGMICRVVTGGGMVVLIVQPNDVWVHDGNGNWTTGANWSSNPNFPSNAGEVATFGIGSSLITVNLDANETVGGINFTNPNSFVIASAANTLALDNQGRGAGISVTAGTSNLIATAVALNDNTTVGVAGGTALSLSGDLSSWGLLTKVGDGPLTLTGSNTFVGGIAISQGTLALGSTNALGTGALTLSGGNLDSLLANLVNVNNNEQSWNSNFTFMGSQNLNLGIGGVTMNGNVTATVTTNTLTVGGMISSVNILTKAGNGTLVLSGANGVTFSGGVTITGGTVAVADDSALGTGTLNLSGAGVTLRSVDATARTLVNNVSPNVFDGPYILGGTGNLTFSGTIASGNGQKRFVIENTTTTFSGPLTDNGAPTGPVIKDGPGALILSADNSLLTKALTVNAGTLSLGSATAIGTGTLTLNGGNLDSLMADLVNANNNAQNWNTNFAFLGSQNLNLGAGNVTMTTNCTVTVNANTLTVGGPVNGPAFSLTKAGAGKLVLSGANTYRNTTVSAGTLEIAQATLATNSTVAVASGAVLQLGFTTTNQVAGLFLNGVSQPDGVYGSSTPGGYLAGPGYLLVHALGPSGPAHLTNNVSGSTLSLSWPAGQGWRLQAQTNALTTGLGINWSYVTDGSVSSTNVTIDASNPTVFYRLVYP